MTEEKTLFLVIKGVPGWKIEIKHVKVMSGVSPCDVFRELSLEGFVLVNSNGEKLDPEADLFNEVEDGERLYAFKSSICGGFRASGESRSSLREMNKNRR